MACRLNDFGMFQWCSMKRETRLTEVDWATFIHRASSCTPSNFTRPPGLC